MDIGGDLFIKNGHGSVQIEDINGDVEVTSTFAPVRVEDTIGDIIIMNKHGNITVEDIFKAVSSESKLIKLETSFGVIKLKLPADVSANLKASTTHGKIKCDFPVYLEKTSSNALKISGKLGEGKDRIELEGKNTSIYIK